MKVVFILIARISEWITGKLWFADDYHGFLHWLSVNSYEWMLKCKDILKEKYKFKYEYKFI